MAAVDAARARAAWLASLSGLLVSLSLVLTSCTSNPYYIGATCQGCGGASGSSSLSFAIDLDHTGASLLPPQLVLPSGAVPASLVFHAEKATGAEWLADQGARLVSTGASPRVSLEAPFTDSTRALGLTPLLTTYAAESADTADVGSDDFVLEVVLRAATGGTLFDRRETGAGWSMEATSSGALTLTARDAQQTLLLRSEPLLSRAWYHCLFWLSRSAGGRADCNGREGTLSDVSTLGSLRGPAGLSVGGGPAGDSTLQLGYFALFRTTPGGLGAAAAWGNVSRQRFAALTGASPRVARGAPLPRAGVRDAPAYLDLQRPGSTVRSLFLVGPDWPRVVCRTDVTGQLGCGYLGEVTRSRSLDPEASAWTTSGLGVLPKHAEFADGEQAMSGLVPSAGSVAHTLSWTGTFAGTRHALSFFARAAAGQFVAVSASGFGQAVFDVRAGAVVFQANSARAFIEDWGGGLYRCAYVIDAPKGESTYQLALAANAAGDPAPGDGSTPFVDVAALQLDLAQAYPGSPFAQPIQTGDQLSFAADDGNLPSTAGVSQRVRVLLPPGPRLTDQAMLNLSLDGTFDNQVQLFITGNTSELSFLGLRDGATHWAFNHSAPIVDGALHTVRADWARDSVTLSVDDETVSNLPQIANDPPFTLNRIDVGFSANSGGLEGLIGGLEIGPTPP